MPVGEDGEESGSIVVEWGGQFLWEVYVRAVSYGDKVEFDLAKTQSS